MQFYGIDAFIRIIAHVLFIYLSFWRFSQLGSTSSLKHTMYHKSVFY